MDKTTVMVVPCFNEAQRFPIHYWREILEMESTIHWIFVNDGSSDNTIDLLQEIVQGSKAEIINCKSNLGKGNAIRTGFLAAASMNPEFEFFAYIDSDGAFSKFDLMRLINKVKVLTDSDRHFDALISSRVALAGHQINRKLSRHYIGRIVATYLTWNWSGAPYDSQSGFKIFRNSESFRASLNHPFQTSWFVDIEILIRIGIANGGNLDIWEEPLTSWQDVAGSKLNYRETPKLLREILIARGEVARLIKTRGYTHGSH